MKRAIISKINKKIKLKVACNTEDTISADFTLLDRGTNDCITMNNKDVTSTFKDSPQWSVQEWQFSLLQVGKLDLASWTSPQLIFLNN